MRPEIGPRPAQNPSYLKRRSAGSLCTPSLIAERNKCNSNRAGSPLSVTRGIQIAPRTVPSSLPPLSQSELSATPIGLRARFPSPTTDETESGVRKSCCFNAPPALLRFFGGPTANLSRFPWSGVSTLNLSRFPSLGWSCGYSLVFSGFWWSYGQSLVFSVG